MNLNANESNLARVAEWQTRWIQNPATNSRNDHTDKEIREIETGEVPVLVPSLSGGEQGADFSPDLADVVAAWPDLPDAIKAGVLALVRAAIGKRPTDEG